MEPVIITVDNRPYRIMFASQDLDDLAKAWCKRQNWDTSKLMTHLQAMRSKVDIIYEMVLSMSQDDSPARAD